jgi:hypothetical protein
MPYRTHDLSVQAIKAYASDSETTWTDVSHVDQAPVSVHMPASLVSFYGLSSMDRRTV